MRSNNTDLTGQTILVTGANTGIGLESAKGLSALNAKVIIACRNLEKAKVALEKIDSVKNKERAEAVELDLSDLESVRKCADSILEKYQKIDVLINNAGGIFSERRESAQNVELTFAVNHLGPFYFTNLLLTRIKESAPARVVNVSSIAHRGARKDWSREMVFRNTSYSAGEAYSMSKLANIHFTIALASRLRNDGKDNVYVKSLHPGPVRSGFGMDGDLNGIIGLGNKLIRPFEISARSGAKTSIYLASSPEIVTQDNVYYARSRKSTPSSRASSTEQADVLWDLSNEILAEKGFSFN